jgi:nitrate reductase NapE component
MTDLKNVFIPSSTSSTHKQNYYYLLVLGLIILITISITLFPTYLNLSTTRVFKKQKGGAIPIYRTDSTKKNMAATGDAISKGAKSAVSLDTYKKGAKMAYGGVKAGAQAGIRAGEYAGDKLRENASGISNIVIFIFIGFGFMMYIFPVLAMGLIGALTFLIARRTIVDTATV